MQESYNFLASPVEGLTEGWRRLSLSEGALCLTFQQRGGGLGVGGPHSPILSFDAKTLGMLVFEQM